MKKSNRSEIPEVTTLRLASDTGQRRLLDRAAAGEYLSVSPATIDRLIWTGQLPVVKLPVERAANNRGRVGLSRRVLIDVRDLDIIIDRSKEHFAPTTKGGK